MLENEHNSDVEDKGEARKKVKGKKDKNIAKEINKTVVSQNNKNKKLLSIQQNINERNLEFEQLKETRGCPVCKIGEEFQGGAHCCKICQQFIHPWCGKSKEEGSGKEITCKNCS